MAEQLSQSQIDALLKRMSSGEMDVQEPTRKIREYDFRSPKKFTKEQLKALDSLHETFSRMVASYFSGLLSTACEIEVVQIEEQRYYEYSNALPDQLLITLLNMKPENHNYGEAAVTMSMPMSIGYYFIDRVLGGPGTEYSLTRDYTDIELAILRNILEKASKRYEDAWRNHLETNVEFRGIETNTRLLQIFAPEDVVVLVILNVKLGNRLEGTISLCIPATFLEDVIGVFNIRFAHTPKRQDPLKEKTKRQVILETVAESEMEMKAVFDQFSMPLQEIIQLRPDDVIPLNKPIESDVLITVDKITWYTAKLGESKQKKAVKLNKFLSNGDEGTQWKTSAPSSTQNQ